MSQWSKMIRFDFQLHNFCERIEEVRPTPKIPPACVCAHPAFACTCVPGAIHLPDNSVTTHWVAQADGRASNLFIYVQWLNILRGNACCGLLDAKPTTCTGLASTLLQRISAARLEGCTVLHLAAMSGDNNMVVVFCCSRTRRRWWRRAQGVGWGGTKGASRQRCLYRCTMSHTQVVAVTTIWDEVIRDMQNTARQQLLRRPDDDDARQRVDELENEWRQRNTLGELPYDVVPECHPGADGICQCSALFNDVPCTVYTVRWVWPCHLRNAQRAECGQCLRTRPTCVV